MGIKSNRLGIFLSLIILSLYLLQAGSLFGEQYEYDQVARNFLSYLKSDKKILSTELINNNQFDHSLPKIPVAYLVNLEGGGYLLISASKNLTPIKAYSLTNNFDTLPEEYKKYLLSELEYTIRILAEQNKTLQRTTETGNTENQQRWDFLLSLKETKSSLYTSNSYTTNSYTTYIPNTHLLTTKWHQKYPYNKFCPKIDGQFVKVGCTNIAIGQIMHYYGYPLSGTGALTYTWNNQTLKGIFYKNYHWSNMPDSLNMVTPEYQQDEVARLLRDLAIANRTDFGVTASYAATNRDALTRFFGFAKEILVMTNSSEYFFFNKLRTEIDALRPVLLKFPGHMTVADGYRYNSTGKEIHVNFGWGDHSDGYYFLDQYVDPNTYPGGFTTEPGDLEILYNIEPCSGGNCDANREAEDGLGGTIINGKFNSEIDSDEYLVYLKGGYNDTIIIGFRESIFNYNNRSFFVTIFDVRRNFIISNDGSESVLSPAIEYDFPAGKYIIKISLCSEENACYALDNIHYYTVSVTTSQLSDQEKEDANNDNISPRINNDFKDIIVNSLNGPHKILIDAVDEDGDSLVLSAHSTNSDVIASIDGQDVLTVYPKNNLSYLASKITVYATADGKTVSKSFIVLFLEEALSFGEEILLSGLFENQDTFNKHKVILDGPYTITGYNGYSNQGFYTSVMGLEEDFLIEPQNVEINDQLSSNQYLIGASLRQNPLSGVGSYFPYHDGLGDTYLIKISCPGTDTDVADIASMYNISLAGTGLKNSPYVNIDIDEYCGIAPLAIQFYANSYDLDGDIVSHRWHIGETTISYQENPSYTFTSPGIYSISCTVKDNNGLTANDTFSLMVNEKEIKIGNREEVAQAGYFEENIQAGRNSLLLYNVTCFPYTSFDLLRESKDHCKMITVQNRDPESKKYQSSYWFFGKMSGKEIPLPEKIDFSESVPFSYESHFLIDLDQED